MVCKGRQAQLLQVALALNPSGGLPCILDGRKKQSDKGPDDRDDDQQLNQGKTALPKSHGHNHKGPVTARACPTKQDE